MSRRKVIKPLNPWETANSGNVQERYIRPSFTLFQHPAFTALKPGARIVYLTMIMVAAGKNEFTFSRACYAGEYGLSHNIVCNAIPDLVKAGFIQVKRSGKNTRTPNIYRFVSTWKGKYKPP